jgi:N-glycosylase/DNA lyase
MIGGRVQPSGQVERAVLRVAEAIRDQPPRASIVWREQELWRELVACILGSGVPYERAAANTASLAATGLLRVTRRAAGGLPGGPIEFAVTRVLSANSSGLLLTAQEKPLSAGHRYPRLRGGQICESARRIYGSGQSLGTLLRAYTDGWGARTALIAVAAGIGPKQASLFLRNVGHSDSLAILDRHVLRYMALVGIACPISDHQLARIASYHAIERKLDSYASRLGFPLGVLDLAVWVVMRVCAQQDCW